MRLSRALQGRTAQIDRPFPNINGAIYFFNDSGANDYNAANIKFEKRFRQGLTFLVNYTFSKNIEKLGAMTSFTQLSSVMLDSYHPEKEKAVSPLDVSHVFKGSWSYELPLGPRHRWLNSGIGSRILGGWIISNITSVQSGFPGELRVTQLPPVFGAFNFPDRVLGVPMYLGKGPDGYLNPAAFRIPGTVADVNGKQIQTFGNLGRLTIRAPGVVNLDLSLLKKFVVTERIRVQFRAESFNFTNTPSFNLGAASTSSMTCTGKAGQTCQNVDFGTMSSGSATGRQIQFGLKLEF